MIFENPAPLPEKSMRNAKHFDLRKNAIDQVIYLRGVVLGVSGSRLTLFAKNH